jgi:hypothetical protein
MSDAADTKPFPYTPDGIKSIAANIQTVSLTPQIDGRTYLVEIEMKKDPFVGGGQDWNSVSSEVYNISKTLLGREETTRIGIKFRSPKNSNFDWATVFVRRDRLPPDWAKLTYHQFFARVEPLPTRRRSGSASTTTRTSAHDRGAAFRTTVFGRTKAREG